MSCEFSFLGQTILPRIMRSDKEEKKGSVNLIYDKAKHHFLGEFPTVLPIEQAYVHIGMFLGWMLENDLYSEIFEEDEAIQVIRFRNREMSCSILSAIWDGYLGEDLFNEEGNAFSISYYQSGKYHQDYLAALAEGLPSIYHVEDSWDNYNKMAEIITERYNTWKDSGSLDQAESEEEENLPKPEELNGQTDPEASAEGGDE